MTDPLHDDEIAIDPSLVRALVDRAHPEYAGLAVRPLTSTGSTNALFRLGDELLVRLPRQPGGSATIDKEARWLPQVGPHLPVAVPAIVSTGEPDLGYPERWSVVRWIDGDIPEAVGPSTPVDTARGLLADDLADLISAFRRLDVPRDAQHDPGLRWYRGDPLAAMDDDTRRSIEACRLLPGLDLDLDAVLRVWDEAMRLPGAGVTHGWSWYHGDLVAENLLVRDGRLAAVLDFGGLAVGDPTIDLTAAWEILDPPARDVLRTAVSVDDATWLRARGWALALAVMTFPYYWHTMPARCANRLLMIRNVLDDAGAG